MYAMCLPGFLGGWANAPQCILLSSDRFQVDRINTSTIAAEVINLKSFSNRVTIMNPVGNSVSAFHPVAPIFGTTHSQESVAALIECACPRPTPVGIFGSNVSPESGFCRSISWIAALCIPILTPFLIVLWAIAACVAWGATNNTGRARVLSH